MGAFPRPGSSRRSRPARAAVRVSASGVPKNAFQLAWSSATSNASAVTRGGSRRIVARRIRLWERPAVAVDPATAELLGDEHAVAVHIPLTDEARGECELLIDCPEALPLPEESGWFTSITRPGSRDASRLLIRGAIYGEVDPLDDEVLRAALGRPPRG